MFRDVICLHMNSDFHGPVFCLTAVVGDTIKYQACILCNLCHFSCYEISRDKGHGNWLLWRFGLSDYIIRKLMCFKTWVELIYVRLYGGSV